MKALTSSCSKAIIERLLVASSSPSNHRGCGAAHVPDKVVFSFSRNDKRGCKLCFLKLDQNKGICPVHAVPSKTEVNLEPAEPLLETQVQQSEKEQTNEPKFVRVTLRLQKDCSFGEQFLIVGDDPILGCWDPLEALPMTWSDGHIWTVDTDMPVGKTIQFKFILKRKGGDVIWQPGSDRIIQTWETTNRIVVTEDWENSELQKIVEEDQLAQSNEEPQVDTEVLTFAENSDNPKEELLFETSEVPGTEASQTHAVEKPIAEPDQQQITGGDSVTKLTEKPMAIVAENIGSSEDSGKSNMIQPDEESSYSPRNDYTIHNLVHNGNAAPLENDEAAVTEGRLFDFEPAPVLVPGLTQPVAPTEEEEIREEVEERTTTDTSSEALESKDQNTPEFSEEQEPNDGKPQEINAKINNEPELCDNEHEDQQSHIALANEDGSNFLPVDGNEVLQSDIKWGRDTVKKFLTRLGFL